MDIHETGYAWRYIRKSLGAMSAFSTNVLASGASMTLVGLLPPICDNGNMLVDGGYREYRNVISAEPN